MDIPTLADLDAFDRLAGRATPPDERERTARRLETARTQQRAVRDAARTEAPAPALTFDPRLPGTVLPAGASRVAFAATPMPRYDGEVESLALADVPTLARLLRARKVTSVALTRMYLERLRRFGPRLLCVVELCEARALSEAAQADAELAAGRWRGPLHGVPYGVKDLLAADGTSLTAGAAPWRRRRSEGDAVAVARLKAAGAVLLAKLSMGELAWGDRWFGGRTRNPWRPTEGSSGSSAGSACATAAGLVGFSLGSETYGSIVSPCLVCGVTGLRPTFGRVARTGAVPLSWSMDKIGPIGRGVEDCALVLAAIQGADPGDPSSVEVPFTWRPRRTLRGLRIGVDEAAFAAEEAAPAQKAALATLETLGAHLVPIALPARSDAYDALPTLILFAEAAAAYAELIEGGRLSELDVVAERDWPAVLRTASTYAAADYLAAQRLRRRLMEEMDAALREVDAYVTVPRIGPSLPYTNLAGHPEVVTRCGQSEDGLPLSLSFVGALYRDDTALQAAHAFARATEAGRRWPDVDRLPAEPPAIS